MVSPPAPVTAEVLLRPPAVGAMENRLVAEVQKLLSTGAPSAAQEIFDTIKGVGLRWSRSLSIADVRKARTTVQKSMQEQMCVDEAIGRFQEQAVKLLRSDQEAAGAEATCHLPPRAASHRSSTSRAGLL